MSNLQFRGHDRLVRNTILPAHAGIQKTSRTVSIVADGQHCLPHWQTAPTILESLETLAITGLLVSQGLRRQSAGRKPLASDCPWQQTRLSPPSEGRLLWQGLHHSDFERSARS